MIVRMIHPQHGAMHAYDQGEVEKLVASGWVAERAEPAPAASPADVAAVIQSPEKRPGRPRKKGN